MSEREVQSHTLREIREAMAELAPQDQVRIEVIATSMRNIMIPGGNHAVVALALVFEEARMVTRSRKV